MELTIYQQTKDTTIKLYCEDCKPQSSSQRGTLVIGGYDHFCSGCGHDFREIAEEKEFFLALDKVGELTPVEEQEIEYQCQESPESRRMGYGAV